MADAQSNQHDYREELESGLINLVVTLCQQKAMYVPMAQAKLEVIDLLDRIKDGLQTQEENK